MQWDADEPCFSFSTDFELSFPDIFSEKAMMKNTQFKLSGTAVAVCLVLMQISSPVYSKIILNEKENPVIRSAVTYVFEGEIPEEAAKRIKEYCINPVDSRETDENKPETLVQVFDEPADVAVFEGFKDMPGTELKSLYDSLNLAMTFKDFLHIQKYFAGEEKRDPSVTEIRVLDTYWSDHCRHTTFLTELKNITFA